MLKNFIGVHKWFTYCLEKFPNVTYLFYFVLKSLSNKSKIFFVSISKTKTSIELIFCLLFDVYLFQSFEKVMKMIDQFRDTILYDINFKLGTLVQ